MSFSACRKTTQRLLFIHTTTFRTGFDAEDGLFDVARRKPQYELEEEDLAAEDRFFQTRYRVIGPLFVCVYMSIGLCMFVFLVLFIEIYIKHVSLAQRQIARANESATNVEGAHCAWRREREVRWHQSVAQRSRRRLVATQARLVRAVCNRAQSRRECRR